MNDVIVMFARLWGQKEVLSAPWNDYDECVVELPPLTASRVKRGIPSSQSTAY